MCFQADAFQNDAFLICDQPAPVVVSGGGAGFRRLPRCPVDCTCIVCCPVQPEQERPSVERAAAAIAQELQDPKRTAALLGAELAQDTPNDLDRIAAELGATIEDEDP